MARIKVFDKTTQTWVYADKSFGKDGTDGKDGVSPTVAVNKSGKVTTISITDKNGTKNATINDGTDGTSVTVTEVLSSSEDGGGNIVTFSDGTTLTVKNGSKGSSGYTPIKGKDYFDGKDGLPGVDGKDGYTPQKGIDYFDGQDGSNGVSATHSWNGTVLTVTSASGSSSADLKGAKGDKGDKGDTGATGAAGADGMPGAPGTPGEDGYTPVKGVDYYTASDKAEWSSYIASELAKRGQLKPEFANSTAECTDTTKLYVLPDGMIYAYMLTEIETGPAYTNQLPISIKSDKTAYVGANGEKGYNPNFRVSSSGSEKAATGYYATGFIPVKKGDTVRIKGMNGTDPNEYCVAYYAGTNFTIQASITPTYKLLSLTADGNNVRTFSPAHADTAYMRLTFMGNPADIIITVNEEITESGGTTTGYAWASTGHAFVPADYEGRIVNLEKETTDLRKLINSGSSNNTESGSTYTNVLPSATKGSDQATGWVEGKGYTQTARLSGSSGTVTTNYTVVEGVCVSGYIPVTEGDIVRIKGFYPPDGVNAYVVAYNGTSPTGYKQFATVTNITTDGSWEWNDDTGGWYSIDKKKPLTEVTATIQMSSANFGSGFNAIRFSGVFSEEVIVTINEKISTGNTSSGGTPSETLEESLDRIKNWKYPIHEDAPIFLLENDKPAISSSEQTTEAVYAKYDALMNANPGFITKVNCGMASDGSTPIYVYHFKEAEPHYSSSLWSETKPVLLICSGVHPTEQSGVHSLFHAMEEITTNSKLRDLRRNVHFIVMPMINPTAFTDTSYGVRNPDGIQVHYNFEVDFKYPSDSGYVANGNRNHGGETPLSIPETQYFDALMNEYKENLALVISCHNNDVDEQYGTGFIWCSCATHFMCNLGFRFVDKMSAAWREKYGTAFDEGVRWANEYALAQAEAGSSLFNSAYTKEQPEWDYRVGRASISGSGGTEYKQALKYGVHGINVEVCDRCMILDKDFGKKRTANVVTMGTETYINFFRTFMAIYDPKNKKDYAPNLPRK